MAKKTLICLILSIVIFSFLAQEAAAFYFSISIDPQRGSTEKGGVLKTAVNVYSSSSEKGKVSFFPAVEPKGVRIRFKPSSCRPSCNSVMTISVSKQAEERNYSIPVVATGGGKTRTDTYHLTIGTPSPSSRAPHLISPLNNSTVSNLTPLLDWSNVAGTQLYEWAVGNRRGTTTSSFLVVSKGTLKYNTKYDWRVRACSQDNCSNWSETRSFITPKNKEALLETLRAQISIIQAAILRLQAQLMELIISGAI